jgi:hypothetical protein
VREKDITNLLNTVKNKGMMEFIKFIAQDAEHFWGFVLVLVIILSGIVEILKTIFKRK